jgi:large subunit ribosomal protein L1
MKTEDVVREALECQKRNFVESVDLSINLKNIDMKNPSNRISEDVILPFSCREAKICVFADGETAMMAKELADSIISSDEIKTMDKKMVVKLAKDHDFFVAEASLMPLIGKNLGRILGPRGKMPEPISSGIEEVLKKLKRTVKLRSGDKLTFHVLVGKRDMEIAQTAENIDTILNRMRMILKEEKIKSVYVKTTMGRALRVL